MSRVSSSVRSRKATMGPDAVTATAVGQQSHTRVSIASSDSCVQSRSNIAVRRPISFFERPSSHTRPSDPPGASNSDANPCSLFVPS